MSRRSPETQAILRLGIPMMAASLVVAAAQVVVLGMLGHLGGHALYVRAAYTPIVFAFLALGEAIGATTQVSAALSQGRNDARSGMRAAARLLALGTGAFAAVAGACWLLAPELARFVDARPDASAELTSFIRWMSAASVLMVAPLSAAAMLRGFGRVGAAAAITGTFVAVDILLVAILGFGLDAGVLSLAWAAALSATVAGALAAVLVLRAHPWRESIAPAPEAERGGRRDPGGLAVQLRLLRDVGLPILGSYVALFAFGLLLIRILSRFGPDVVSGFSVGYSVQALAVVPAIALGSAGAIYVNQLRGAGRAASAPAALTASLRLVVRLYAAIAVAITALAFVLPFVMTSNDEAARAGREYLLVVGPSLVALGVVVVILTVLEQVGAGGVALALNVVFVALVAGIGAVLAGRLDSPLALYATAAVTSLAGAPLVVAVARRRIRRLAGGQTGGVLRCRAVTEPLRDEVYELFGSRDFLFKTYLPWLASARDIDGLLADDTRVITLDDRAIGLVELEEATALGGHYRLHYRLRADLPPAHWASVLEEVLAAERDELEILRLTYLVHERDERGREVAERCGFAHEGMLPSMVEEAGRRYGVHFYARLAELEEAAA
jgi:Na+-driven multidrug efflux pump